MRMLIAEQAPNAVEAFSYGIIGYKLNNKPLVYIGGFKNHIGFYATPNGHEEFAREFSAYTREKAQCGFLLVSHCR